MSEPEEYGSEKPVTALWTQGGNSVLCCVPSAPGCQLVKALSHGCVGPTQSADSGRCAALAAPW